MLLIVRHQIVRLAGERLGHDPGIGSIIHDRGGTGPLLTGRRRPHLRLRLMQQSRQEGQQLGRLPPEHLIDFLQYGRPDPNPDRAALAQLQERACPSGS